MQIKSINEKEILCSSGKPSIEIELETDKSKIIASVPNGTSTGKHEVNAFVGSVRESIDFFRKNIKSDIIGKEFNNVADIFAIEKQLEGYVKNIGGNTILCLSYAMLRSLNSDVYKIFKGKQIPNQVCNIIGGGSHGKGTEFQEFLAIPITKDYDLSMTASGKVHFLVGEKLRADKVGLEGAWLSKLGNERSLDILREIADVVTDEVGFKIGIGLDVAAAEFYKDGKYIYKDKKLDRGDQIDLIVDLTKKFKLHYVEDPLDEDDFDGFAEIHKKTKTLVVGDDLFTTNNQRLKPVCNASIVKPNQIGMMYKVVDFLNNLKKFNMTPIISHRSQETMDPMIADLAVGLEIPYIKVSVKGDVRVAKMKRIEEIYDELRQPVEV